MSWIRPTCSCGWTGWKEYAYSDDQFINLRDQERTHRDETTKAAPTDHTKALSAAWEREPDQ